MIEPVEVVIEVVALISILTLTETPAAAEVVATAADEELPATYI